MSAQKKRKGGCFYLTHGPICIRASGQWIPAGVVADLSDCEDAFLSWALRNGLIETTDPSQERPAYNEPVGAVERPPCTQCGKK